MGWDRRIQQEEKHYDWSETDHRRMSQTIDAVLRVAADEHVVAMGWRRGLPVLCRVKMYEQGESGYDSVFGLWEEKHKHDGYR